MPLDISDIVYVNAATTLVQQLEEHPMYDESVRKTIDEILEYSEDKHRSLLSLLHECHSKQRAHTSADHVAVGAEEGSR